MPKRKRSDDDELEQKFSDYQQRLFRALKAAKGLERQRLSKRVHEEKFSKDKIARLEREIAVLKSLDLHQTANSHLSASLLKIKALAEHPLLPDHVKHGGPSVEIPEDEKAALHNVTSGLYSRPNVREVVDQAIRGTCLALEVPVPDKKRRRRKCERDHSADDEIPTLERKPTEDKARHGAESNSKIVTRTRFEEGSLCVEAKHSDGSFQGFSDTENDSKAKNEDDDAEQMAVSGYEALLGSSDDERDDPQALRARYGVLLNNHAGTDTPKEGGEESEDKNLDYLGESSQDDDVDSENADEFADGPYQTNPRTQGRKRQSTLSPSPSVSPPPSAKPRKAKQPKIENTGSTTFLPTLMGGYLSGSESASDVDVAPTKKRLGQRQRQAKAERKFGEKANHLSKQTQKHKKGRDSGWDLRRGAVDPGDAGAGNNGRKSWKTNISRPLPIEERKDRPNKHRGGPVDRDQKKSNDFGQKDDQGPLHPSWEARKREKEVRQTAAFQGTKVTF